jgi:hypothetical protein
MNADSSGKCTSGKVTRFHPKWDWLAVQLPGSHVPTTEHHLPGLILHHEISLMKSILGRRVKRSVTCHI